jgi:hypothetical protein
MKMGRSLSPRERVSCTTDRESAATLRCVTATGLLQLGHFVWPGADDRCELCADPARVGRARRSQPASGAGIRFGR